MIKTRKIQLLLLAIVLCVSCFLTCFALITTQSVYASSVGVVGGYTDVMEDLQKDDYFNEERYSTIEDDYSLQVIQIAESSDKELFVYVYQPCGDYKKLVATSLFLSTTAKGLDYKNYYLSLLSNNGVFYKYRVDNFFVGNEETRHYEITSIYRAFDETIDAELDDDNENMINEVNYQIAKHWTFNDNGLISCSDIETIKITDKYVGFVRYGYADGGSDTTLLDRHFVAFSTNKRIDKLMEIDVYYKTQTRITHYGFGYNNYPDNPESCELGEISGDKYATVSYTNRTKVEIEHDTLFWHNNYTYEWDLIQKPDDFVSSVESKNVYSGAIFETTFDNKMTAEGYADIKDKQWVVTFLETETPYDYTGVHFSDDTLTQTLVSNVSIMRLAFLTDGIYYDLGVIDNKQSGDGNPDNLTTREIELTDAFKIILAILLLIVLLMVLSPILPIILSFIWWLIKIIFKIVILVVFLPFKLVKAIFKKRE